MTEASAPARVVAQNRKARHDYAIADRFAVLAQASSCEGDPVPRVFAIAAMFAGVAHGLAQALSYAGINILQYFPGLRSYYQGLTVHGVAQALILTFAFSNGFLPMVTARALGRPLNTPLLHATFWAMAGDLP